jgi:hypothetical protein
MIAVVLGIVLTGIFGGESEDTLLISVVLTIVAYLIGDLLIFRKAGDDHEPDADHNKRNTMRPFQTLSYRFLLSSLWGNLFLQMIGMF